jgi:OLD-like protein
MDGSLVDGERRLARRRERADYVPGGPEATSRALERVDGARAVVLVEGFSDQLALETLAARRGRDLAAEGVVVVPIGGAQAIGRFLAQFGPDGADVQLAGLCDVGEEGVFRRGLERAGFGPDLTRADMERLGFHVCVTDLEDELIRAVGATRIEAVLDAHGDLGSFRTFQKQPAWRGQKVEPQLKRFVRSSDRRNLRYARLLVDALDLDHVPRPLDAVLAHV